MGKLFYFCMRSSMRCFGRYKKHPHRVDGFFVFLMIAMLPLMYFVSVSTFRPWYWAFLFLAWRQHFTAAASIAKVAWKTFGLQFGIFWLARKEPKLEKLIREVVDNIAEFNYDLEQIIIDDEGDFGVTLQDLTKDEPKIIMGAFMNIETGIISGSKPCFGSDEHRNFYAYLTLMEKERHNG